MYFFILNILLGLFFLFLIIIGILLKYHSYIPLNVFGLLIVVGTIFLDSYQQLTPGNILLILLALVIIFITNLTYIFRDFREEVTELDAKRRQRYLVEGILAEHFKLIRDLDVIKNEINRHTKVPLTDRVQSLEMIRLGNEAFNQHQYQEALEKYDLATNLVETAIGFVNQSGVLLKLGQFEDALVLAEKAEQIQPNFYEALLNQGVALEKSNQFEAALAKYEKAATLHPDEYEIWFCAATILFKLDKFEKAIQYFDRSLNLYGRQFDAWYYRGIAQQKLGDDVEALRSFEQAIKIQSSHSKVYYRSGNILSRLNRDFEAIAAYERAIKINPNIAETWNNLGVALNKIGRVKDAIKCYDRATKINANYFEAWLNMALAEDAAGQLKNAYASYSQFLAIAPTKMEHRIELTKKRLNEIKVKINLKDARLKKPGKSKEKKKITTSEKQKN